MTLATTDKPVLDGECGCSAEERADPNGVHRNYHIYAEATPPVLSEYVQVPRYLVDQFPEINPRNYNHDEICALNSWGCELVSAALPSTKPLPEAGREGIEYKPKRLDREDLTTPSEATPAVDALVEAGERVVRWWAARIEGELSSYRDFPWAEDAEWDEFLKLRTALSSVKATPEQGGREAVHRAMNERDKHWIFALGAFRQLPADEVQAVLARLPALGSFTTPRSEEDIRKAVVEALRAVLAWAEQRCPCSNDEPNPCPLCGASVENLEPCKSAENTMPRALLATIRAALHSPADRSAK